MSISYVLPLRWQRDNGLEKLTAYLEWLAADAQVIVVDGSPPRLFERHHARWVSLCLHVPPDEDLRFANGKVSGVQAPRVLPALDSLSRGSDDLLEAPEMTARISVASRPFQVLRQPQSPRRTCSAHSSIGPHLDVASCLRY